MQLAAHPQFAPDAKRDITRHWRTAGAVVIAAGMFAAAPGLAPVATTVEHEATAAAVRLTAGWDLLTPWKDAVDTAIANGTVLSDNFLLAPGVGLQQAIVNQIGYAKQLFDDPSSFQAVAQQFADSVMKVAQGISLIGADEDTYGLVAFYSLDGLHGLMLGAAPSFMPEGTDVEAVTAVMNFLSSPLSGVLMGAVNPMISPAVALINSAQAIAAAAESGDASAALAAAFNVPAGMVDAFLNGADLNLDALVPMINNAGFLPEGTTINNLDIAFGGLLTPGSTGNVYEYTDADGNTVTVDKPGGSIFNSIGMNITTDALGFPMTLPVNSNPIGPIGALQYLSQTVGMLLGDGWENPDGVKAPLFGIKPPALGDIFKDPFAKTVPGTATENVTTAVESAAANELTHATATKAVTMSVPAANSSTTEKVTAATTADSAKSATASTDADTDEKSSTATESVQTTATAAKARTQPKLVKDIKAAVKNVRTGLTGSKTETTDASSKTQAGDSKTGDSKAKSKTGDAKSKTKAKTKSKD